MRFKPFSEKQLRALTWWCDSSPHRDRDAIICDGAVRSGKTLCLSLSFVLWAMYRFSGENFALCGKTVTALRRNLVTPLLEGLDTCGVAYDYRPSQNRLTVHFGGRRNHFWLFGGRDEASAPLIQGITLAGVLLDEVALMPRSFVEQALARCSVEGSRFWFNCNPEHPGHWFYLEWIQRAEARNALYLHFTMEDNPALAPPVRRRYETLYTGSFYDRYVLGRWTAPQGAVYPMFSREKHVFREAPACDRFAVSCDYGTVNPASFGFWGHNGGSWYRLREFYHDSRREGRQLTDEEYADALAGLVKEEKVDAVLVDPSAASFIRCLRKRGGLRVLPARNEVADGIRRVASALHQGRLLFHCGCADALREFTLYRWDPEAPGDHPVKEHDHAMDDIRYFAAWAFEDPRPAFAAAAPGRRRCA